MDDREQLDARLDRLEKAGAQIRFVMAIEKWAAGAALMLMVFVVNQCSENAINIKTNVIEIKGLRERLAELDKQVSVLRETEAKNAETTRINTGKLESVALSLQDLDKRATVNRETEAKDTVIIKELSLQSDNNLQRQIDTLGFQIQMVLSPDKAIKESFKLKGKASP